MCAVTTDQSTSAMIDPSSLEVPAFLLWSLESGPLWLYIHFERDFFLVSLAKENGGSSTSICHLHRVDDFVQEYILYLGILGLGGDAYALDATVPDPGDAPREVLS